MHVLSDAELQRARREAQQGPGCRGHSPSRPQPAGAPPYGNSSVLLHASCRLLTACAARQRPSQEELFQADVLGWCIEWVRPCSGPARAVRPLLLKQACAAQLQAFFLVADDIMDASHTRRGQPCWYKLPEVRRSCVSE